MPSSTHLPSSQELAIQAFVGSGVFATRSEIIRSGIKNIIEGLPKPQRLQAAFWAYQNGKATLSQTAALAGIEHGEMQRALVREGLFRGNETAAEIEAGSDLLLRELEASKARRAHVTKGKK